MIMGKRQLLVKAATLTGFYQKLFFIWDGVQEDIMVTFSVPVHTRPPPYQSHQDFLYVLQMFYKEVEPKPRCR
jgi:hypothetical protein